ncbi:MAG: hypothetical protein GY866_15280 [Proteobacteria bacterium]|nr:hypothetical protein [Pseudomonadota bacterium]
MVPTKKEIEKKVRTLSGNIDYSLLGFGAVRAQLRTAGSDIGKRLSRFSKGAQSFLKKEKLNIEIGVLAGKLRIVDRKIRRERERSGK